MKIPRPVLDPELAEALSQEGMRLSDLNASEAVREAFDTAIDAVAARQELLCSDDVWVYLGVIPAHGAASALGGAFARAAREGIVRRAGTTTTQRPTQHKRQVRQWRSLLVEDTHVCRCEECGRAFR